MKSSLPSMPRMPSVLTINGGSSSIRFALYEATDPPQRRLAGKIDRIGLSDSQLIVTDSDGADIVEKLPTTFRSAVDYPAVVEFLPGWLEKQPFFTSLSAVGHRVVHGMQHIEPELVTPELLAELRGITPYAPEHLPNEIALIEAFRLRHPKLLQVACFDTAFHRSMPRVASLLPIPRHYAAQGIERYGFHGLSYTYLMEQLGELDPAAAKERVILAHLGNGASLAAVSNGKSIDTSMSLTPAAGLMMGARSGDIDPGLFACLARTEQMTATQFERMMNHESGLLGVSEISADIRDLLAQESSDVRAAEAVALFCYQAKKWIGAYAAALGGVDTLVFSGGIGENAPSIRARICENMAFLGIELDESRNVENAAVISTEASHVTVRVIPTNEELMIARSVIRTLNLESTQEIKN